MMKRRAINDKTDEASTSRYLPPKRTKTNKACTSCKKNKTRCEVLDAAVQIPRRCHRCKVLDLPCSFEETPTFIPPQPGPSSSDLRSAPENSSGEVEPSAKAISLFASDPGIQRMELPVPPNASWGTVPVHGVPDWMATPMFAIQKVTIETDSSRDAFMNQVNVALRGILTPDRLQTLLRVFENKFSPWLNLQPHQPDNVFHKLACCLVASRLLDANTRASIVPRLETLLEQVLGIEAFNPTPSVESIQAMMILALWTPVGGQAKARDGRLLIASAVSMAVNLHINKSIAYLARNKGQAADDGSEEPDLEHKDARNKARLWLSLMNAESLLCIGTGREALLYRTASDYDVIDWSSNMTVGSGRDIRLALIGQLFGIVELGLRINLSSKQGIETFYKDVVDVLLKFDELSRLITPLSAVTEHEGFHFSIMKMEYHACRILVLQHCLRETERVYAPRAPAPYSLWYRKVICNGVILPKVWGKETILLAEEVLVSALLQSEQIAEFSTAPDSFFSLICFSAAFLVMTKLAAYRVEGALLPGLSDTLLARICDLLTRAACGPDHVSAKCARLISTLVGVYEARIRKPQRSEGDVDLQEKMPPVSSQPEMLLSSTSGLHSTELPALPDTGIDISGVLNSDIMLDSDFWASFMDNLVTNEEETQEIN